MSKSDIRDVLIYSQVSFAMNAARVMKALVYNRSYNRTEREIITFAFTSLIICTAKLWDKSGYSLEKSIKNKSVLESEKLKLLEQLATIRGNNSELIDDIHKWRNNLMGHIGKDLTVEIFQKMPASDLADIQKMIKEVAELIQSTSWYPNDKPIRFLDCSDIHEGLRL